MHRIQPGIINIEEKLLIGLHRSMSLSNNETQLLWQTFMPRRHEITNGIGTEVYSLQVYPPDYFVNFQVETVFEKWALIEVENTDVVPSGMSAFRIPAGLYAVFHYRGSSTDKSIYQYIFGQWLPASAYELDARPHFEVLGERYSNTTPDSEEDIWIPVRPKS